MLRRFTCCGFRVSPSMRNLKAILACGDGFRNFLISFVGRIRHFTPHRRYSPDATLASPPDLRSLHFFCLGRTRRSPHRLLPDATRVYQAYILHFFVGRAFRRIGADLMRRLAVLSNSPFCISFCRPDRRSRRISTIHLMRRLRVLSGLVHALRCNSIGNAGRWRASVRPWTPTAQFA